MSEIKIHQQIANFRKKKGLTQEELAKALGVTNQAVSKWESGQCCPDIQLLPTIAELFRVSVDELLGQPPLPSVNALPSCLRREIDALPEGDDFAFAFRTSAALHAALFAKSMRGENPGWDTDESMEHAADAAWGYSCLSRPDYTTLMQQGCVLFSDNRALFMSNSDLCRIASVIKPFGNTDHLKIAYGLYQLTASSETARATAAQISAVCGLPEESVKTALDGELLHLLQEEDGGYRFQRMYLSLIPVLSLMNFKF